MAAPATKPAGPFTNSDYEIGDHVEPASRRISDTDATLASNNENEVANFHEKHDAVSEKAKSSFDAEKAKLAYQTVNTAANRRSRRSVVVPRRAPPPGDQAQTSDSRGFLFHVKDVGKKIVFMFTNFLYWDMAFWTSWSYSIGSALFVIDGVFSYQVAEYPKTAFKDEEKLAVPLCFFIGACFYQYGAVMAYFEAINDGSFAGSAMKRLLEGHPEDQKKLLDDKLKRFFGFLNPRRRRETERNHSVDSGVEVNPEAGWEARDRNERPRSVYPEGKEPAPRRGGVDFGPEEEGNIHEYLEWRWWPTWHALRTKHLKEIGYVACSIQLFGVTLYGVTSVIILPGVFDQLVKPWQQLAAYWIPQVVAALCFLISSLMFTYDTQEKWNRPAYNVLAWWIGVWATIGSVGFVLIAIFGIIALDQDWAGIQTGITTIWGSAAYMTSALLQWYEVVNAGPVLAFPNRRHIEGTERSVMTWGA